MVYSPNFSVPMLNKEQTGAFDLSKALQSGFETYYKPKNMAEQLLAENLQNKIKQPYADNAEEAFRTDMDYKRALMQQAQQGASPFSRLAGPAKEAYSLEILKNQLGEDHPAYQNAKQQYDLEQQSQQGLNTYRQGLTESMTKRSASSLGKLGQEEEDVIQGFEPNTGRQHEISPDRQEELLGQYALAKQKISTDSDTRKKTLFASNIDKTIDSIDKKDLTRFAGLNGAIRLKEQEAKSITNPGSESEDYKRYLESANKAQLLAKQVRQFYGDSIQPAMLQQLQKLSNPATWRTNPEIASRLFDSFTGLLKQETGTYRGALKNKKEFEGASNKPIKMTWDASGNLVRAE
jgi:hypothetical protein